MKSNEDLIVVEDKKVNCIDFPGHQRLQIELNSNLKKARVIVFVLDASTLEREISQVAQYLYDLLTKPILTLASIPVIVCCNKQDDALSIKPDKARTLLENEL